MEKEREEMWNEEEDGDMWMVEANEALDMLVEDTSVLRTVSIDMI